MLRFNANYLQMRVRVLKKTSFWELHLPPWKSGRYEHLNLSMEIVPKVSLSTLKAAPRRIFQVENILVFGQFHLVKN